MLLIGAEQIVALQCPEYRFGYGRAPPTDNSRAAPNQADLRTCRRVPTTLGDQRRAVGEVHQPQRVPAPPYMVASWGRWFGLCPAQGSLWYSLVSRRWELRRVGRAGDLGPHRR